MVMPTACGAAIGHAQRCTTPVDESGDRTSGRRLSASGRAFDLSAGNVHARNHAG
jgi:hypothetical protein